MNHICCLLDACVIINLIHISEDDFILKKMNKLDLLVNDMAFDEVRSNVYSRLKTKSVSKYENKEAIDILKKSIDQKLTFFRGKKNDNEILLKDLGCQYFEKIKEITGYKKRINGELCSTGYALYVSRYHQKKVFFYTDDYPARDYFSPFFDYQQIGQIKDSIDLLVLLFWLDENFTTKQLDNALSELYSQYATSVTLLKESLQKFYKEKVDAYFIRTNKLIAENLRNLIIKLDKLEFTNIRESWAFFEENKVKCREIFRLLEMYHSVLDLEMQVNSETIIGKIMRTRTLLAKDKIYKWGDLLDN